MNIRTLAMLMSVLLSQAKPGSLTLPAAQAGDSAPGNGSSDAEKKARADFAHGYAAYKSGQFAQAVTDFEAGYALSPRPGFILNIGHAWRKLGNLHKARAYYQQYLLIEPDSKFRESVTELIAELDTGLADEERAAASAHPAPATPTTPSATSSLAATTITTAPPPALNVPTPEVTLLAAPSHSLAAPTDSTPRAASGFYRRPLFWVAAVVVVTGAALGLVLWQRSSGSDFHATGDLGSIGP